MLWFIPQKTQIGLLPKNKPSIQSPFYKPTIKLAFISTDLSTPH
ncbi:hypothetical protein [Campylobacter concisus]|nr:hypothetical protein [Campylobacter concisus]